MGNTQDPRKKKVSDIVLKEVQDLLYRRHGAPLDLETTKDKLKHVRGIDSGKKFLEAVDDLVARGLLTLDNGRISQPIVEKPQAPVSTPSTPSDNPNLIYGRVVKISHDNLVFVPNDRKAVSSQVLLLNDKKTLPRFENKLVSLELSPVGPHEMPMGTIVEILGEAGNPIAEYDTIAQAHGSFFNWSDPKIQAELAQIPLEVDTSKFNFVDENGVLLVDNGANETVVDLTGIAFSTTDPITCRDMDDAIFSTFDENGNLVIYTAVADVTRYVDPNSEIGKIYFRGGFTFYASNRAYNILPTELSTGICSINPNVNRMAFVVRTVIDPKTGNPVESKFMNAMICSREKFHYEQAQEIVDQNPTLTRTYLYEKCKAGVPLTREEQVVMNKIASDILEKGFAAREAVQFNTRNEYKPVFSEDGLQITDIQLEDNCAYHKVIANFMITTNEEAARFALEHNIPIVYRVHDEPNDRKIAQALEFFGYLHIPFDGDLSPQGTRQLLESVKGTRKEKAVNNFLVRMQSKAKYSVSIDPRSVELMTLSTKPGNIHRDNHFVSKKLEAINRSARNSAMAQLIEDIKCEERLISHFGLQSYHYSHTTSPIRRITDYITHYNIKAYLNHTEMLPISFVREIAIWANERQDEIAQAEREQQDFDSALYASTHINQIMKGKITGFRSLVEGKISGAQDIMVLVENEETGIKVQIPAPMILGPTKEVRISQYGSALVKRSGTKALLSLCQDVTFKIAEANPITRTVYGSTNLATDYTKVNFLGEVYGGIVTSKVSNLGQQSDIYTATHSTETRSPSRKETRDSQRRAHRDGADDEADEDDSSKRRHGKGKHTSQSYKSYKQALAEWEDYTYEDYLEEAADISDTGSTPTSDDDDIM